MSAHCLFAFRETERYFASTQNRESGSTNFFRDGERNIGDRKRKTNTVSKFDKNVVGIHSVGMKFLVFQHVPHESLGLIAEVGKEMGAAFDVLKLWEPYSISDAVGYDGLIIMGGPMGVYDKYASEHDEITFISRNLEKIPMIGFCLGSQLIAHALGAKVYKNIIDGRHVKEIGFYDVALSEKSAHDLLFKGFSSPVRVLQWHGDAFDLPNNATLLASSPACKNQAFRFGKKTYGMLFHNEFTPEMVDALIEIDKEWIHKDFSMDEEKLRKDARINKKLMRNQCKMLFSNFCKIAAQ